MADLKTVTVQFSGDCGESAFEGKLTEREHDTILNRVHEYFHSCKSRRKSAVLNADKRAKARALKMAREAGLTADDLAEVNEGL